MRFNPVGFALTIGMALIAVLLGFTLLNAAGLVGFTAGHGAGASELPAKPGLVADTVAAPASDSTVVALNPAQVAEIAVGDALFKGQCAQCHAVNEVVVGPALAGISQRRPVSWLIPWIKNSSKVVASGDEYAVELYNKYGKQQMPSFALSDQEVKSILTYIDAEHIKVTTVATR